MSKQQNNDTTMLNVENGQLNDKLEGKPACYSTFSGQLKLHLYYNDTRICSHYSYKNVSGQKKQRLSLVIYTCLYLYVCVGVFLSFDRNIAA